MNPLKENDIFRVAGKHYILELHPGNRSARLLLLGTHQQYFFHPGGECDTVAARDEAASYSPWRIVSEDEETIVVGREEKSNIWDAKEVRIACSQNAVELYHLLKGEGTLTDVRFCRGGFREMEYGFVGEFDEIYNPAPNFQERLFYHPVDHFTISNGNDLSGDVGGHALASCCHCIGLHDRRDERYLSAGVAARPGEYTWDCFVWNPKAVIPPTPYEGDHKMAGGFAIEYAGKKKISGSWESPRLIFTFAKNRENVLPAYLKHCYRQQYLPRPARRKTVQWWDSPIYCTWHDQGSAAYKDREINYCKPDLPHSRDFLDEKLVEEWLAALMENDCKPGILILDDKWQLNLNDGTPDEKRFPEMRKWIERCHDRGIRVFLWTAAWNTDDLPPEQCMKRDGKPICGDITHPEYEKRFREMLRVYFSDAPGCLDADGVKMDGLLGVPTGPGLENHENLWGLELQKRYLKILYEETKKHKKNACVSTFVAHPYLAKYSDMVRIADMYTSRLTSHRTMLHRAEIYRQTMPYALIDTDGQFSMYMLDDYASELAEQAKIGIPCLYNAKLMRRHHFFLPCEYNELTRDDYREISKVFRKYNADRGRK